MNTCKSICQSIRFNPYPATILLLLIWMSCSNSPQTQANQIDIKYSDPIIEGISIKISNNPEDLSLYYQRAKLYYEKQNYEEAIEDLIFYTSQDSLNIEANHLLADVQLDNYQSRDALNTLKNLVHQFPQAIPSILKLSEFQHILKQYDESIISINDVLAIDPENAEAYLMLGVNFRTMLDTVRAIHSFQRATELDPELSDAWILLGQLYEDQENPLALQCFDNAIRPNPNNVQALHSKAFYLQNHGDILGALEIYKEINAIAPQYIDAYLNTGILYLELDSFQQAYEHFNTITGIDPSFATGWYYKGIATELSGEKERAKTYYQNALNLNPDIQQVKQALKRLEGEK